MKINKTVFAVISMFLLSAGSGAALAGGTAMEQLFKDAGNPPAAADIVARTQALKITPAQVSAEGTSLAGFGDRRAAILAEIETLKVKFQKYENDPLRSGICAAELSRLYMELANANPLSAASAALPARVKAGVAKLAGSGDRRAEILAEIGTLKVKFQKYENDPLRSGIYAAELSRLYLELANLPDGRTA